MRSSKVFDEQAKVFRCLMHPARLAILEELRSGEQCVCHLESFLGYRQAYISQHLMVLRDAGLVEDQRDGWNIFYRVVRPEIFKVLEAMNSLTGQMSRGESIPALGKPKKTCPCPKCNPDKVSGKC